MTSTAIVAAKYFIITMIGKHAVFIRSIYGDRGVQKNQEYSGLVLDKYRTAIIRSGEMVEVDCYVVQLPGDVIAHFFPDEAVKIINDNT